MDQKAIDQAIHATRQWSIYRPLAERGISPAEIKNMITSVLDPYFSNKDVLEKYAVSTLGSEAFRVTRIKQDPWAALAFDHVSHIYRNANLANATACYQACAASEPHVMGAVCEFRSLFHLEIDKAGLSLQEFTHEAFRNIGTLVEAYLLPHLRDLLVQVRLARDKPTTYAQTEGLTLGNVIDELHSGLGMPELVSPPPWGIRLNHWRNIAQHYRSRIRNDMIYSYYGRPPN